MSSEANRKGAVPAIELEGVSKHYRRGRAAYGTLRDVLAGAARRGAKDITAMNDVSLRVERGEVLGVVGNNGAGKSTLLKAVARVVAPDAGRITVRGRLSALIEVGAGFHPELTGAENVLLHGSMLGLPRKTLRAALPEILAFAGVRDAADTPVKFFSTGMYARLGFSVAVHAEPDVLLVDEVLSVGDVAFREQCTRRIEALKRSGTAFLFVSHDGEAVRRTADRAILLKQGTVALRGTPSEVWEAHQARAGLTDGPQPSEAPSEGLEAG